MRLEWPEFERNCRTRLQATLRHKPELRKEFRKNRPNALLSLAGWIRSASFAFVLLALLASFSPARVPDVTLAIFTLWASGSAFRHAQEWFQFFYASPQLAALHLLPLRDKEIFSVQWRIYARKTLILFPEFLAGYFLLWANNHISGTWLFLAPALQAAVSFALTLHLTAWLGFAPLGFIGALLKSSAVALLLAAPFLHSADWLFHLLHLSSPAGWINYLAKLKDGGDWTAVLLVLPIGGVLGGAFFSYHRLRSHYSLEGMELDFRNQHPAAEAAAAQADDNSRRAGPTEVEDNIRDRFFLQSLQWENAGWMERWAARFLNPREKIVAEFLVAENPGWSQAFSWTLVVFGVAITAVSIFGKPSGFTLFLPGYLLAATALPIFGASHWRGMTAQNTGGTMMAPFALYPVSFDEAAKVIAKINLARSLPGMPLVLLFIVFAGWKSGANQTQAMLLALKLVACFVVIQPALILIPFSAGSNDTTRRPLFALFVLLPLICLTFAGGIVLFLASSWKWSLLSMAFMLAGTTGLLLFYRLAYRKNRFDLIKPGGP